MEHEAELNRKQAEFQAEMQRSMQVPVVVSFWSRQEPVSVELNASLEALADEFDGKFLFVVADSKQSRELAAMARRVDTPWGALSILEGERARAWYEFYLQVQDFNHRRRQVLAEFLFGEHAVIINATHQGMVRALNRAGLSAEARMIAAEAVARG